MIKFTTPLALNYAGHVKVGEGETYGEVLQRLNKPSDDSSSSAGSSPSKKPVMGLHQSDKLCLQKEHMLMVNSFMQHNDPTGKLKSMNETDKWKELVSMKFAGSADTDLPHYILKGGQEAKTFTLSKGQGSVVKEKDVLPQYPEVQNVVAVLSYFYAENSEDKGKLMVAAHEHMEGNTFGFPQQFFSCPGGRIDEGMSSLSAALTEAYEEMGFQEVIKGGDKLLGYYKGDNGVLYLFIELRDYIPSFDQGKKDFDFEFMEYACDRMNSPLEFFPFTMKAIPEEHRNWVRKHLDETSESAKRDPGAILKQYGVKVLFPRPRRLFNSARGGMYEVDFNNLLGQVGKNPGRFNSFVYGSPICSGLRDLYPNV